MYGKLTDSASSKPLKSRPHGHRSRSRQKVAGDFLSTSATASPPVSVWTRLNALVTLEEAKAMGKGGGRGKRKGNGEKVKREGGSAGRSHTSTSIFTARCTNA